MYSNISKIFKIAIGLCLGIAILLFFVSYTAGREAVFLWLNNDLGNTADLLFNFFSHLAEGWIWIPYFMLVFGWFKKDAIFILLNFLISTLLTQIPKNFIWAKVSRPLASNIAPEQIHTVKGVEMHFWNVYELCCIPFLGVLFLNFVNICKISASNSVLRNKVYIVCVCSCF